MAATNFAAWWTEARWVWTVCLRLLPDCIMAAIWSEPRLFCAWVQHANHSATEWFACEILLQNIKEIQFLTHTVGAGIRSFKHWVVLICVFDLYALYARQYPASFIRPHRMRNAPLIRFLISALYNCLLVYIVCFPAYPFFFTFFYLSPPFLIFSFENRPALFQAGCRKRRLNLALVFFASFFSRCNTFLLFGECMLLLCYA